MADVFIRPSSGGPYGAADGSSYADAFAGFDARLGIGDGDTVWIGGGTHVDDFLLAVGDSGSSDANRITWRGDASTFDSSYEDGILAAEAGTVALYFNGCSYITVKNLVMTNARTTAGIFYNGTTAGIIIDNIDLTFTENVRGIYMLGTGHTDWQINNCTVNNNAVTPGNTQSVYIWGNNATAGTTGQILNLTCNGLATFTNTNSNHVGLHIDDWNGLPIEGYKCTNMFAGVRLTNSDSNTFLRPTITGCGLGLKSDASGGGFGFNVETSSASNKVYAARLEDNYQHYVDSTASGGNNELHGSLLINALVNSISYTANSNSTGLFYNNVIIHNPTDVEGHGMVVQSGGVVTKAKFINNIVICGTTGTNIQCVAVGGTTGTNYQDVDFTTNAYYVTNGAIVGKLGITEYAILSAWSVAANADARITETTVIDSDPLLTSSYKLSESSPCVGAGTTGLITNQDTYDQPIPSFGGVDIGNQSSNGPFHPVNL